MMTTDSNKLLNVVFFFFEDDFFKWPMRNKLESFIDTNIGATFIGITFPLSPLTIFSNPRRLKLLFKRKQKVRKGIYSFTPFGLLPVGLFNRSRFFIGLHKWIFRIQINRFLDEIGANENRVTWLYYLQAFPVFWDIIRESKLLVYDCWDENTLKENTVIKFFQEMEDELLRRADVVFAVSRCLYETRREKNKNCFLIPNGVDFSFFSKARFSNTQIHQELKNIPRPIVGYLGMVRSWLDFELINFLADHLPNISFVFVGPVVNNLKKSLSALKKKQNIYFIARKDRQDLPSVLKAFDVCTIPFKYNKFNLATNPLKFWEYLATGRPILSLRIPDFEIYEDLMYLHMNKEEALDKLQAALKENDFRLQDRRVALARENDISLRSRQYYELMLKYLNDKNRTARK